MVSKKKIEFTDKKTKKVLKIMDVTTDIHIVRTVIDLEREHKCKVLWREAE